MLLNKNKNKGSVMVELVIATAIITVFVLLALNVAQKSIVVSRQAIHATQAAFLLEEGAETVKIFRDNNDWTDFITFFDPISTYCLPSTVADWNSALSTISPCATIDRFTRTINVTEVERDASTGNIVSSGGTLDAGTKLFTITVSWTEAGNPITKILQFYVSDIFS